MNESLQRWRSGFAHDPDRAFDDLLRGIAPLGTAGQLSFGEVLDILFEPGDSALDLAASAWLEKHTLAALPESTSVGRWVAILEDYFRGIASMDLARTSEVLRERHRRIRLWLNGFYSGPDRDPYGAYLLALARAQNDHRFSTLWRDLILGEEFGERPYVGVGILGFRKMPDRNGRESSDVPQGLLQALVALAEKPGTNQTKWRHHVRSLFATYRRSEGYWVERFAVVVSLSPEASNARTWLEAVLPRIREKGRHVALSHVGASAARQTPGLHVSKEWARRVRQNVSLIETEEYQAFLEQHRAYAETTGEKEYISKTLNNLSLAVIRADRTKGPQALSLIEEALKWDASDARNWLSYAIVASFAVGANEAISILWRARHRFAFDPYVRNELGRFLRQNGDLAAAEFVFREAISHFPGDVVCRTGLAETMRAMGRLDEALEVYRGACRDFPSNAFCRNGLAETLRELKRPHEARDVYEQAWNELHDDAARAGLADLLIDLGEIDDAERLFREVAAIEKGSAYGRSGLARALAIRSARTQDVALREEARHLLQALAAEGHYGAVSGLRVFDAQWERAKSDPTVTFRRDVGSQPRTSSLPLSVREMSTAERLGRAMIALWRIERTQDPKVVASLSATAFEMLAVEEREVDEILLPAFVETFGLVLVASGRSQEAQAYFENQIQQYGRGGWMGVRLGQQRARLATTGQDDSEEFAPPSSSTARFALYVMHVVKVLSGDPKASEVRDLLKSLFGRSIGYASNVQPSTDGGQSIQNGAEMLALFLRAQWFEPADITSVNDLDQFSALQATIDRVKITRTDTLDVISNSALALAA